MAGAMRERFVEVVGDLLDTDPRVMVLTADLTAQMLQCARDRHPLRAVNLGIREQLLIDAAGGAALAGMRPIAHSFAPFLVERPFEQIKISLNHQGVGAILVSAGGSYDIASGGRTHQAPGDVALLNTLPDWTIHVPGHPDEAETAIRTAACTDDLVYVRLSNQVNQSVHAPLGSSGAVLRRGSLGTVLVVGPLGDDVLLATNSLDVTVVYTATPRPLDSHLLRSAVGDAPVAQVALVEPMLEGTSAAELRQALGDRPLRLLTVGVPRPELRNYGTTTQHAVAHGLDAPSLHRRLRSFFDPAATPLGIGRHR